MGERAKPPNDIHPQDFFTRWLPGAVAEDEDRRRRLAGTRAIVQFELQGDGGGIYVVRIDAGRVEGSTGPADTPDLRVRVDVDTWRALNRGEISAPEALLRRRIHIEGSFLLALRLHLILG